MLGAERRSLAYNRDLVSSRGGRRLRERVSFTIQFVSLVTRVIVLIHTMDHLFDSILVIFAKIDHSSIGFLKLVAASTVEESASRTHNGSMHGPLSVVACNRQICVLRAEMKTASC